MRIFSILAVAVGSLLIGLSGLRFDPGPLPASNIMPDTVTYGDLRIVYTVATDTATNEFGQIQALPDLANAPAGARFKQFDKLPNHDSAMLLTGDTFAMSPTDSATAKARAIAWGVADPFTIQLEWHNQAPAPVTGFTLVMSQDTIVADWNESADNYQVTGGLNDPDPSEDYTDTVAAPPNKQVVSTFGSYWTCVRAFIGVNLSDSRCTSVDYDSVGGDPPPSLNDPIFVENFESWNTANWRAMDTAKDPYDLFAPNDQFIETSGSAEGSQHLRLFRFGQTSAGTGCTGNTVGLTIESGGAQGPSFPTIMNGATEFWVEFWVKFDAAPSSAPWGNHPDPAWACGGNPDHKLWRFNTFNDLPPTGGGKFWAMKDGTNAQSHWVFGAPPTGTGGLQNAFIHGSHDFWRDNTWHLVRIHGKRSSVKSALDAVAQFTIDSLGTRVLLNNRNQNAFIPTDALDIWWDGWNTAQFGVNRNHWTNHNNQFRFDKLSIWTNTGNGGPGWVGETLVDP